MTEVETAKKILEQGHCGEVSCMVDNCPAFRGNGFRGRCLCFVPRENEMPPTSSQGGLDSKGRKFFEDFLKLKEDKGMDKEEAIKRLDALDHEAAELRKIIEGDELVYDKAKMYIWVTPSDVYVLHRVASKYAWISFEAGCSSEYEANGDFDSGQRAVDGRREAKGIYVFSDPKEGLKFLYEQYMKAH